MSVPRNVARIVQDHVTFELECLDRMYLNVYVPALQCESGVVGFFRRHRGHQFASSALMDPMTKSFVAATECFAKDHGVPVIPFQKGQRKDDVMAKQLRHFEKPEGVAFIGKAQEKTPVLRRSSVPNGISNLTLRQHVTECYPPASGGSKDASGDHGLFPKPKLSERQLNS